MLRNNGASPQCLYSGCLFFSKLTRWPCAEQGGTRDKAQKVLLTRWSRKFLFKTNRVRFIRQCVRCRSMGSVRKRVKRPK